MGCLLKWRGRLERDVVAVGKGTYVGGGGGVGDDGCKSGVRRRSRSGEGCVA